MLLECARDFFTDLMSSKGRRSDEDSNALLAAATSLTVLGFVTGAGGIFTFWFCWTFVPPQPTKVQLQQRDEDASTKAAARDDRESEMASLLRENE